MVVLDLITISSFEKKPSAFEQVITDEFLLDLKANSQKRPVIFLLGGFQGSGNHRSSLVLNTYTISTLFLQTLSVKGSMTRD